MKQGVFLRRTLILLGLLLLVGGGVAALFYAWRSHLVFCYTPTQFLQKKGTVQGALRLGGRVTKGSLRREGVRLFLTITDGTVVVPVVFSGALPRLFQEGQGIVAEGSWCPQTRLFQAKRLLVKHDEVYAPVSCASGVGVPRKPVATR